MKTALLVTALIWLPNNAALAQPTQAALPATVTEVNVRSFGAKGDGKSDDTSAFRKAIERASATHASVRIPFGTYCITDTLTVRSLTLIGQNAGAWVADDSPLPVLLDQTRSGPMIRLLGAGGVHGLLLMKDWKGGKPHACGPAVELAGTGCRVTECRIHNAWDAVAADGKSNVGRALISDLFIVDAHNVGVRILGTWDCSWISRVEVWAPTSESFPQTGIGFLIGKNDMLLMSDCFVFRASCGYRMTENIPGCEIKGVMWGSMSNCSADFSSVGVEVDGGHTVSLSGGTYWTHWNGLVLKGKGGQVRMSGLEMKSNGGATVDIQGGLLFAASGCQFRREMQGHVAPALKITSGGSIAVSGCVLSSSTKAIEVDPSVKGAVVEANAVRDNVPPPEPEKPEAK